jgi:hypothetical protein
LGLGELNNGVRRPYLGTHAMLVASHTCIEVQPCSVEEAGEGAVSAGPPGARVPTASSDLARGVVVISPVVPPVSLSPLSVPDVPPAPAEPDAPPEPPDPALPFDFEPLLSWACTEAKVGRLNAKAKAVVTSSLRIWNLIWPVSDAAISTPSLAFSAFDVDQGRRRGREGSGNPAAFLVA